MDVVCERCQTEYEFDDALVSERGTTVKCTNCGHQFKIYRPPSTEANAASKSWSLRRVDGTSSTFDSLAVLQKWIIEGRVTRSDQISRAGEPWKPLGVIAELDSFFASAESRNSPARAPVPTSTVGFSGKTPGASNTGGYPVAGRTPGPAVPPSAGQTGGFPAQGGRKPAGPVHGSATNQAGGTLRPPAGPPPPPPSSSSLHSRSTAPDGTPGGSSPVIPSAPRMPGPAGMYAGGPVSAPSVPVASPGPAFSMGTDQITQADKFEIGNAAGIREQWAEAPPANRAASVRPQPAIGPPPPARAPANRAREVTPPPRRPVPNENVSDDAITQSRDPDDLGISRRGAGPSSTLIGVGVGLLVGTIAVVGAWKAGLFARPVNTTQTAVVAPPDRIAAAIMRAEDSAKVFTRAGFEEARDTLTSQLGNEPDEARVRAARSAVMALWGEQVRQHAEDLEARAAVVPADAATMRAEAILVRRDATASLERARQDATVAEASAARVTLPADRVKFERALGETARVLGDASAARRHLDAARTAGGGPEVELLAALLERDAGDTDTAVNHLRAVSTQASAGVRAHLAMARIFAARGDAAGATVETDAVLREQSTHEDARALAQAVRAGQPPFHAAAGVVPVAAAGARDAGAVAVVVAGNGNSGAGGSSESGSGSSGSSGSGGAGNPYAGRNYDSLLQEAERLQSHGQRDRARAAYIAAVAARPSGSEAVTGLGFVELDGGNASVAIEHFRRALSINSRYSEAYIGLGQAYQRQSDSDGALRAYREYLAINPGGSRARMAQHAIETLEARNRPPSTETPGGSGSTTTPTNAGGTGSSGSSAPAAGGEPSGSSPPPPSTPPPSTPPPAAPPPSTPPPSSPPPSTPPPSGSSGSGSGSTGSQGSGSGGGGTEPSGGSGSTTNSTTP